MSSHTVVWARVDVQSALKEGEAAIRDYAKYAEQMARARKKAKPAREMEQSAIAMAASRAFLGACTWAELAEDIATLFSKSVRKHITLSEVYGRAKGVGVLRTDPDAMALAVAWSNGDFAITVSAKVKEMRARNGGKNNITALKAAVKALRLSMKDAAIIKLVRETLDAANKAASEDDDTVEVEEQAELATV